MKMAACGRPSSEWSSRSGQLLTSTLYNNKSIAGSPARNEAGRQEGLAERATERVGLLRNEAVTGAIAGDGLSTTGYSPTRARGGRSGKSSVVRRLARRSAWLKSAGSYLDYMQYYFSNSSLPNTDAETSDKIYYCRNCQHTWVKESRGSATRFRGIGCGERDICPLCGSYTQVVISRESARTMLLAQEALEVELGVTPKSYGLRVVLPLAESESERIDALLFAGDTTEWLAEISKLYSLAGKVVKQLFGGAPFCLGLDLAGESAPTEPHYHVNAYVFPVVLGDKAEVLPRYFDKDDLAVMRNEWRCAMNEAYGLNLVEADISVGYLRKPANLYHWMRYLYRHLLSDIWRGWRGYDAEAGVLHYAYKKEGDKAETKLDIPREQLNKAFLRCELIPAHFKRIRWYGALSDGQRGKTLEALGLVKEVKAEDDDGADGDKWLVDAYYSFVRYDKAGVVLNLRVDAEDTGQLLTVMDSSIAYAPKGVNVGRRIVWHGPADSFRQAMSSASGGGMDLTKLKVVKHGKALS